MNSKLTNYLPIRKIFGKVEIKIIFDILMQIRRITKCRSKLFFLTGLSETGKTFSLITLSKKIGKDIPLVFSSGFWINSFSDIKRNLLLQMSRQAIGIKFYQENFIIKGVLVNLEIKNKKINYEILKKEQHTAIKNQQINSQK
jgi:DNA helicase TIP49 (TBP-interacting protein)